MKFKLLTLLITKMLGVDEEAERADMHLPVWIAGFGFALVLAFFFCVALFIVGGNIALLAVAVLMLALAIAAFLCYKNQRIYIISDEEFQYSTFTGKKTVYKFSDIKGLRRNSDSMTLFVADGKVHIESAAVMSERLVNLINLSLEKNQK